MTTTQTAATTTYKHRADAYRDLRNARTPAQYADAMRRLGITTWTK
jgi:hypothetical protein